MDLVRQHGLFVPMEHKRGFCLLGVLYHPNSLPLYPFYKALRLAPDQGPAFPLGVA